MSETNESASGVTAAVSRAGFEEMPPTAAAATGEMSNLDLILDVTVPVTVSNGANVLIFGTILYGVSVHARRTLHARIMTSCFVADLVMVLLIEVQKHAVEQAVQQAVGPTSGLKIFHIAVSVAAVVLWVPQ